MLEIEYKDPRELIPYENNARKHGEEDIEALRASIRKFGFTDPIGIWSDKNIIVEGHGRQQAAILEGMSEVPCIRLDNLTDEQRRAYALAHNKTAELSYWDMGKLEDEIRSIFEINMDELGFFDIGKDLQEEELFTEAPAKERPPKTYTCPHCGAEVTA